MSKTTRTKADQAEATGAPVSTEPADPTPGPEVPARRGLCRVSLCETSVLNEYVDPQTHLVVTKEPREVRPEQIGRDTRRMRDVTIQPFDGAQDEEV